MRNLSKLPLPKKWEINKLLLPAKGYQYFQHYSKHLLQKPSNEHSAVSAWWMAECALLAYETENVVKNTLKKIKPLTKDGALHCQWLDKGSTQGFILEADDFMVLSVRGTEFYNLNDFIKQPTNILSVIKDLRSDARLQFIPLPDQDNNAIRVVQGFYKEFNSIRKQVDDFIAAADKPKPIWLTGHSLGASIVTLVAFYQPAEKVGLYTFGSPCTGNHHFSEAFRQRGLSQRSFRYVNGNDLVANALSFWRSRLGFPDFTHVGRTMKFQVKRSFFYNFIPLDMTDHAPIYYALKCWNSITP